MAWADWPQPETLRRKFQPPKPQEASNVKKTYLFAICLAALVITTIAIASIAGTSPVPSQPDGQPAGMMSIPF